MSLMCTTDWLPGILHYKRYTRKRSIDFLSFLDITHILKAISRFLAFNGFEMILKLVENTGNFSILSTSSIESKDQPELSNMLAPCKISLFIHNIDELSTPNAKRSVFITIRFINITHRSKNNVESGILGSHCIGIRNPTSWINPRAYKGWGVVDVTSPLPHKIFLSFCLEDKTSAPDVFSSCSFIPRADFETSLVMVNCYGYEIWHHK